MTLRSTLADFLERISPVKKVWNGCNSGGWRSDLLKVNGFDESMKYGAEDVEMGVRLLGLTLSGLVDENDAKQDDRSQGHFTFD